MSTSSFSKKFGDAVLFIVSIFVLFGAFAFYQWSSAPKATKSKKGKGFRFAVRTQTAQRGKIDESLELSGDLMARRNTTIASETTGAVTRILAREGTKLRKGQTILYLNRTDQTLNVQKQQALLQQAKAGLLRARAILARDRDQYKRTQRLRRSKTVAENELIQARYQFEASQAAVTESEALIALRKAELSISQRDLSRTVIRAPFDGEISRLYVEAGKWVKNGDPIVDFVDAKGIEIRMYVPPRYIGKIAVSQTVDIFRARSPQDKVQTRIARLLPIADASSRNREIIAYLKAPPPSFLPGLPIKARVTLSQREGALLVKKDALIRQGNGWLLFKVQQNKARRVEVQILNESNGVVEVSGDVKAGDQVVTVGNEALFHNAPVASQDPFAKPKATSSR
ncbi:MAG: efflux RND transporter periplasmic adaptor subunit [Myxococcales bacterium]|nr:efflux RND transporter periplasmic adaptor subunit [Myxococcales bacterium]